MERQASVVQLQVAHYQLRSPIRQFLRAEVRELISEVVEIGDAGRKERRTLPARKNTHRVGTGGIRLEKIIPNERRPRREGEVQDVLESYVREGAQQMLAAVLEAFLTATRGAEPSGATAMATKLTLDQWRCARVAQVPREVAPQGYHRG